MSKESRSTDTTFSRRSFLKTASAATAGLAVLRTAQGRIERTLKAGLVGCGGRGMGAASDILQAENVVIHAIGDAFKDRVDDARTRFEVPEERCFVGFDAYQKVLETDIDIILLATPPHFRPEMFEAAVAAGKHIFMEKPVAVDPVGVRRIMNAGEAARQKGLSVVAGTQRRHQQNYVETQQRVADGALGQIVAARVTWWQGDLWRRRRRPEWTDMEFQIRNWLYFSWLSGDHIVEQHIHNIDVVNWFVGSHPIRAYGMGGRMVRTDIGNIYDHFTTIYEYPNGTHLTSMCGQCTRDWGDVSEFLIGDKGTSNCSGEISGENKWRFEGSVVNPYVMEHVDFIEAIRNEEPLNESEHVVESTLTAIMGRTAAYTGKPVFWDQIMQSNLRLGPTKYEWGPVDVDLTVPKPQV